MRARGCLQGPHPAWSDAAQQGSNATGSILDQNGYTNYHQLRGHRSKYPHPAPHHHVANHTADVPQQHAQPPYKMRSMQPDSPAARQPSSAPRQQHASWEPKPGAGIAPSHGAHGHPQQLHGHPNQHQGQLGQEHYQLSIRPDRKAFSPESMRPRSAGYAYNGARGVCAYGCAWGGGALIMRGPKP